MRPLRKATASARRAWRLAAVLAAVAVLASACSGSGAGDRAAATGGTLTVATSSDILTLDPAMHRSRITQTVIRNVFDALVNQDDSLRPVPELATSWQQVDPTTWRFELRKGVKFQDGESFDANAVKFTIDRILDPKQDSPRASMLSMVKAVTVEDADTVVITTKEPSPTLLAELAVNEIVPPAYVQRVGDKAFAAKPIGTGPFKFSEWVANERVVLTANDDYWGGRPKVDKLVFRPIPEVSARIAALQSGDAQIATEVPPDLAGTLKGDTKAVSAAGTRIFFLAMNVRRVPFTDRQVRIGVNEALDRDTLVRSLYHGFARSLDQPAFPEMVGYDNAYQGYPFDLAKARSALAGARQPIRIDAEEKDRTLAQAVAGQLQAAGLKATVNVLETQAFTQGIEKGASQAYLSSWGVAEGDSDVIFATHFWSPTRAGAYYTGYRNPALDKLIVQGRSTTEAAARTQIYKQATEMLMGDAPWAPIANPREIYGVSAAVRDWKPSPIGRINVAKTSLAS